MKILKHFTANDEKFEEFPFKRELSMESYLIENEGVLALDDDIFSEVEIIEEELTLKQGRSSKDTDGRIDILAGYSQEYLGVVELKLGELNNIHLDQLEDYLIKCDQILTMPNVKNTVYGENKKWIGVLVGRSIKPDLAEKIKDGYETESGIPIAALTISRFRSAQGAVYVVTDTYFNNKKSKNDTTQYQFNGQTLGKGRLVLEVIKHHVENNSESTFSSLESQFPKSIRGRGALFATITEANETYASSGHKRHYIKSEEQIELQDSTIAVSNQWGAFNIESFISVAKKLGYEIQSIKS
jgi:hypothetical protein